MSLPITWVAAGAIPATQAITQTANLAVTSASHFFGELLQSSPPRSTPQAVGNGRSEPIAPLRIPKANSSDSKSLADRIESIRNHLSKFVNDSRVRFGLQSGKGKTDSISISANGKDSPQLNGSEPARTELENYLREHPSLVQEINEVAVQQSSTSPLRLLPRSDKQEVANEPWTLWLDV